MNDKSAVDSGVECDPVSLSFEAYISEWRQDVTAGSPSTKELGKRFSHKLITQWIDSSDPQSDIVFCDGPGDGGIDIAYLERAADDGDSALGDTWYLIQSKYGSAFRGTDALLSEGQKVIDALDGKRERVSSLADGLLERLRNFINTASDRDRLILLFATERKLTESQVRALNDIKSIGINRVGTMFGVDAISVETIYERLLSDNNKNTAVIVSLRGQFTKSGDDLIVGSVSLPDLYHFLREYKSVTQDLDQLYERNVRKWLGGRGKINKAIAVTLKEYPERFGLYNNGITIVASGIEFMKFSNEVQLHDPYVVNGCQTTRTLYEVFVPRMDSGGKGSDATLDAWKARAAKGVIIVKVATVGSAGELLLREITRYTNSQNAVREKDFLALTNDFRSWQSALATMHGVYLEIQRGGWDSQKALQKQNPSGTQFDRWANAADLMKVFGAGWLLEAGLAYGKNPPFLPGGQIFKRITEPDPNYPDDDPFGENDLYAAFLLSEAAEPLEFGRSGKQTRRQTRFLFFMTLIELIRYIIVMGAKKATRSEITHAITKLLERPIRPEGAELVNHALEVIDGYMTQGADNCIFDEPAYINTYGGDLNAFLKWEQFGKSEADCPHYRRNISIRQAVIGMELGGESLRDRTIKAIVG